MMMSLSEYARYRKVSQPYISKLIRLEKIPVAKKIKKGKREFPLIDSDVVDGILKTDTDPSRQRVATRGERQAPEKIEPEKIEPEMDVEKTPVGGVSKNVAGAGGHVFSKARGLRETYVAMAARLDYEERTNKLIKIKLVADRWNSISAQIKQNLMGLSSRTCANIAAAYKTVIDQTMVKVSAGENITLEQLQALLAAVLDDKKAGDILDAEVRETLRGLADGSFN